MAGDSAARKYRLIILCAALVFFLQGCVFRPLSSRLTGSTAETPFLPATPLPATATIRPGSNLKTAVPTPTIPCQDNLTYLTDVTIPDGTQVFAGSTLDKRWEVENSGSCSWHSGYTLRLTAGDDLGSKSQVDLYPARSGTRAALAVLFQAPQETGIYRSAWQAFNPQGDPFGDPVFIEIEVIPASTPDISAPPDT